MADYRSGLILDVARAAGRELVERGALRGEVLIQCPWPEKHRRGDAHASCRVNPERNVFYCDPCGRGGGVVEFARALGVELRPADQRGAPKAARKEKTPLLFKSSGPITATTQRIIQDRSGKRFSPEAWTKTGVLEGTVDLQPAIAFRLPSGGFKVCFYLQSDPRRGKPYSWRFTDGGKADLLVFGDADEVLLCAGEWDALAALSAGFQCVATGTGGEGTWKPEWSARLKGKRVFVIYDVDDDGRRGARKVADDLVAHEIETYIVNLPLSGDDEGDGKDLSDYLAVHGADELRQLLGAAVQGGCYAGDTAFKAFTAYREARSNPWPDPLATVAYHGPAGDFVRVVEPQTEADPAALLVQLLLEMGNVVGRGPHFVAEADRHYTNLFAGLVGPTSKARKGTSKGHVDGVLSQVDEEWQKAHQQSGLSSGEGLIWAVRDPIMGQERIKEGGRVSYEEVKKDPGISDKRLLVYESELASTLRAIGRDGNILSPLIRLAWDTGNLQVMTKNTPARATGAHISIVGHITQDELRRYLDRTEMANGFANRFLWFCVKRSRALPDGGKLTPDALAPVVARLKGAVDHSRQLGERRLERDEEARKVWHQVYPQLSEGRPGLVGAVISRAEAQVMRLALIYAVLDRSPQIRKCHLEAALAVWEYAEASARYIFDEALGDPVADEILRALRSQPAGLTRTEIRELFGRNRAAGQIDRALALLLEHGLAHPSREETGGRPAERWVASRGYAVNAINAVRESVEGGYRVYGVNGVPPEVASEAEVDDESVPKPTDGGSDDEDESSP